MMHTTIGNLELSDFPIFTISLKKDHERFRRLRSRLVCHDLWNQTTLVPAIWKEDNIVFETTYEWKDPKPEYPITTGEVACMLSHLSALRTFLSESTSPYAIIMEDDAILHNNFNAKFNEYLIHLRESNIHCPPLVMLSYYKTTNEGFCAVTPRLAMCYPGSMNTLCYIISRAYAQACLAKYGKPFRDIDMTGVNTRLTAEAITIASGGVFFVKPLCIEESWSTNIQPQHSNDWHLKFYKMFEAEKYLGADVLCKHYDLLEYWGYGNPNGVKPNLVALSQIGPVIASSHVSSEDGEGSSSVTAATSSASVPTPAIPPTPTSAPAVPILQDTIRVNMFADLGDRLQILRYDPPKDGRAIGGYVFKLSPGLIV